MAATIELQSPIDESFQRLEPVVILGEDLYIKTRHAGDGDGVVLVTSLGVEHPLRRLCRRGTLDEHLIRCNTNTTRQRLHAELTRFRAGDYEHELRYFVERLWPAFLKRDWSERLSCDERPEDVAPELRNDPWDQLDTLIRAVPALVLPSPSYLVLGRFWWLRAVPSGGSEVMGLDHVRCGRATFGPTGEYVAVMALERRWREDVRAFLTREATRMFQQARRTEAGAELVQARAEIAQVSYLQRGDLLFLPGIPPRVGHVLPPHSNRTLGRQSRRDLAMTAPLTIPPRIAAPQVYTRGPAGSWGPLSLPNGLCLGGGPPGDRPEDPGLALLAYLRWAACRIAANGAFHANDDRPDSAYDS